MPTTAMPQLPNDGVNASVGSNDGVGGEDGEVASM